MTSTLTVKQRILLVIALPLLVFILVGIFVVYELEKLKQGFNTMFDNRLVPMHEISMVKNDLTLVIPKLIYSNHTGKLSRDELHAQLDKNLAHALTEWSKYRAIEHGPQETQMIHGVAGDIEQLQRFLGELKNTGTPVSAAQIDLLYGLTKVLNDKFKALMEKQLQMSQELKQQGNTEAELSRNLIISSVVIILLVQLVLGSLIFRSINSALSKLNKTINHITHNADLTLRVGLKGSDELAQIAGAFDAMVSKLQSLVHNIRSGVITLSSTSAEMSSTSNMMAATSEQQNQQTILIASAATEMNSAIREVAHNAVSTLEKANQVEALTRQGSAAVNESIQASNQLANTVLNNGVLIQELNQHSNEINKVVLMIRGVAEQTNLLALNAAIEAARAGESGRGFAVVADEVRQLAHDTQSATESISKMIDKLQNVSSSAVDEMKAAEQSANLSTSLAERCAEIITDIQTQLSDIVMMNAQVSTATEEQSAVIEEISQSITEFHESIAAVTENARQNASASQSLANLGSMLKGEVEQFVV